MHIPMHQSVPSSAAQSVVIDQVAPPPTPELIPSSPPPLPPPSEKPDPTIPQAVASRLDPPTSSKTVKTESSRSNTNQLKLREFNGVDETWELYLVHFKVVKRVNKWNEEEALDQMISKLKGVAMKYYTTLPEKEAENYPVVLEALATRFAAVHSASTARYQLEKIQQKKDQTLEDLAEEIHKLAHAAYDANHHQTHVEQEGVRAFLRAVSDAKLADALLTRDYDSLTDVL